MNATDRAAEARARQSRCVRWLDDLGRVLAWIVVGMGGIWFLYWAFGVS